MDYMRCCNSDAQAREIHMPYSELPFPYCSTAAEATLAAVSCSNYCSNFAQATSETGTWWSLATNCLSEMACLSEIKELFHNPKNAEH